MDDTNKGPQLTWMDRASIRSRTRSDEEAVQPNSPIQEDVMDLVSADPSEVARDIKKSREFDFDDIADEFITRLRNTFRVKKPPSNEDS